MPRTWTASTRGKSTITIDGDEEIRVVDTPNDGAVAGKTTVQALYNWIVAAAGFVVVDDIPGLTLLPRSQLAANDLGIVYDASASSHKKFYVPRVFYDVTNPEFGADPTGVADSKAAFEAADALGGTAWVPPGTYNLASAPTLTDGSWLISPQATFTGAGASSSPRALGRGMFNDVWNEGCNSWVFPDRLLVGEGTKFGGTTDSADGATFLATSGSGAPNSFWIERGASLISYSPRGGIGGAFSTRLSDRYTIHGATVWAASTAYDIDDLVGLNGQFYICTVAGTSAGSGGPTHTSGTATDGTVTWLFVDYAYVAPIGLAATAWSDAADATAVWGSYIEVFRSSGASTIYGMELNAKNFGNDVDCTPYGSLGYGATVGHWIAAGGDSSLGAPANPSTVALLVGRNDHTWNKGLVFRATGLTGTDGVTGTATAIEMAKGHQIVGRYSSGAGAISGLIRFDATAATGQTRLVSATGAWQVKGVQSDLATETILFQVVAPTLVSTENTNYLSLVPSVTGDGLVTFQAAGVDTNINLRFLGKGTGVAQFVNATDAASNQVARFETDRATPAASDNGYLSLMASNSGGTQFEFGRISWYGTTVTASAEAGQLRFSVATGGALSEELALSATALLPITAGGLNLGTATNRFGSLFLNTNGVINWANGTFTATQSGGALAFSGDISSVQITTSSTDFLHETSANLADGAAAQIATLTNGPVAGNPTKWIAVNDNGTTRYIPTWSA